MACPFAAAASALRDADPSVDSSLPPAHVPVVTGFATPVGPWSLADLQRGATVYGDTGISPLQLPPWLDMSRCLRVQTFWHEHAMPLTLSWHCSLVIGFSLPSLLGAITFTGNSDTPGKSLQRYAKTAAHLMAWHVGNIWDPAGSAFASVMQVRHLHQGIRHDMEQKLPPRPQKWISQCDMAVVQLGFISPVALFSRKLGVRASQQELDDYAYFWRCVGYQLGIGDQYNACSIGGATTKSIVQETIDKVLLVDIAHPPDQYSHIAEAYIDGVNLLFMGVPVMSVASTNALTFWGLGVTLPRLNFLDKCRYLLLRVILLMIGLLPPYRRLLGRSMSVTLQQACSEDEARATCTPLATCILTTMLTLLLAMMLSLWLLVMGLTSLSSSMLHNCDWGATWDESTHRFTQSIASAFSGLIA